MTINRRFLPITLAAFFLTAAAPVWAQNTGNYVELRFVQRVRWTVDEYAMRYEVIIEKEEARTYRRFLQEFTEGNSIEVSLPPGKFRCQVIPHDFLDLPIPVTEWVEFEVRPGENQLTTVETASAAEAAAAPAVEIITEYARQFDLYVTAAYVPLLPLYSENQLFGEDVSPFGMSARFGAVAAKQNFLNPGIELAATWRVYEGGGEEAVHSAAFDFNILAQTRFPGGRTALNVYTGAGLSLLPTTQSVSPDGQYSMHVNIGASFLWLFMKNCYMEGGVEHSQFFTEDKFGFFRPWIGLGYKF